MYKPQTEGDGGNSAQRRRLRREREAREPRVEREPREGWEEPLFEGEFPDWLTHKGITLKPERNVHLLRAALCLIAVAVLGFAAFVLSSF